MELWDILDKFGNKTGKVTKRGSVLKRGEFHLVAIVIIKNPAGKFLLSRRNKRKDGAGKWETTGGAATVGEDSFTTAIREVSEEINIELNPNNGVFVKRFKYDSDDSWFGDVWLFNEDVDLSDVICRVEEVSGVKWASLDEMNSLIDKGKFFNEHVYKDIFESSEFKTVLG